MRTLVLRRQGLAWPLAIIYRWPHKRTLSSFFATKQGPVTLAYEQHVQAGRIQRDQQQVELVAALDELQAAILPVVGQSPSQRRLSLAMITDVRPRNPFYRMVLAFQQWLFRAPNTTPGLYLHGNVGVGKSFLMDLFFRSIVDQAGSSPCYARRVHFHEFMLDCHQRLHKAKQQSPRGDAMPHVALQLAQEARLLCFDEFQVTDIADAMILQRLFGMLWQAGTVVVATSNREPTALYEGGINRSRFLPFVDLLQQHMRVVALPGEHDYRQNDNNESIDAIPLDQKNQPMPHQQQRPRYFWPSDSAATRRAVQQYLDDERANGHTLQSQEISIHPQGRRTLVVQRAVGTVAHMDFDELCDRPLGAADYFALCRSFRTLILDHVPPLNASNFNQARRFVTLVDALYESRTRLILAAAVPADALLGHFDAVLVESQDAGDEGLQTTDAAPVVVAETAVTATGGASSAHATTFLHDPHSQTTVEWTATGRVGVSLAQLSAVRDVAFSLARARSRLAEMRRPKWGETKETVR